MIQKREVPARNWLELPAEVIFVILHKLGAIEILTTAQNVCSLWYKICKDPFLWRVIDMHNSGDLNSFDHLEIMCKHAVDRSCGQLVEINIEHFGSDELLLYIANRYPLRHELVVLILFFRITDCPFFIHIFWFFFTSFF